MYRRYSEFQEFYSKLVSLFPMANLPKLPGRSVSTKYYLPNPLKLLACYEWVSGVFLATHKMGQPQNLKSQKFEDFVKQIVDIREINPAESKTQITFEQGLLISYSDLMSITKHQTQWHYIIILAFCLWNLDTFSRTEVKAISLYALTSDSQPV